MRARGATCVSLPGVPFGGIRWEENPRTFGERRTYVEVAVDAAFSARKRFSSPLTSSHVVRLYVFRLDCTAVSEQIDYTRRRMVCAMATRRFTSFSRSVSLPKSSLRSRYDAATIVKICSVRRTKINQRVASPHERWSFRFYEPFRVVRASYKRNGRPRNGGTFRKRVDG